MHTMNWQNKSHTIPNSKCKNIYFIKTSNLYFLSKTLVNFITEDRMLRNTYSYENRMFTNKVNVASFEAKRKKANTN